MTKDNIVFVRWIDVSLQTWIATGESSFHNFECIGEMKKVGENCKDRNGEKLNGEDARHEAHPTTRLVALLWCRLHVVVSFTN